MPRVVIALGLYALVGGFVSFIGWPLDLPRLTDWYNNGISIQPNSTVAVTSSGIALLCLALGYRRVASIIGVVVLIMGSTALLQWISPISLPEWNTMLMFGRQWGRVGVVQPGLMGPPGAVCWTLIGVALVLFSQRRDSVRQFIPRLTLVTAGIGGLSIAGYLYGAERLFSQPYFTVIALQTATFVVAVSVGCIAAVPEQAPTRWLLDEGATGAVARRAVPLVIFIPFFAGWLRLYGERQGLYDTSFGTAGLVLVLIILLLALLSWMLRTVSMHESTMRETERRVTATLESITDGFVTIDRDWRYRFVNVEAAQLLQRSQSQLLGTSLWEAFPDAVNSTSYRELHRAVRDRVSVAFEDHHPGLGRWFAYRAYPTSDGALTVYFQDVTARKQAESERAADLAGVSRLQVLSTKLVQSGDYSSLLQEIVAGAAELTGTVKGNIQVLDNETGSLEIVVHQGFGAAFLDRFQNRGAAHGCDLAAKLMKRVEGA